MQQIENDNFYIGTTLKFTNLVHLVKQSGLTDEICALKIHDEKHNLKNYNQYGHQILDIHFICYNNGILCSENCKKVKMLIQTFANLATQYLQMLTYEQKRDKINCMKGINNFISSKMNDYVLEKKNAIQASNKIKNMHPDVHHSDMKFFDKSGPGPIPQQQKQSYNQNNGYNPQNQMTMIYSNGGKSKSEMSEENSKKFQELRNNYQKSLMPPMPNQNDKPFLKSNEFTNMSPPPNNSNHESSSFNQNMFEAASSNGFGLYRSPYDIDDNVSSIDNKDEIISERPVSLEALKQKRDNDFRN